MQGLLLKVGLFLSGYGSSGIFLWVYNLCGWLGQALVSSEAHHCLCWFLVYLSVVQVQVAVRHYV